MIFTMLESAEALDGNTVVFHGAPLFDMAIYDGYYRNCAEHAYDSGLRQPSGRLGRYMLKQWDRGSR